MIHCRTLLPYVNSSSQKAGSRRHVPELGPAPNPACDEPSFCIQPLVYRAVAEGSRFNRRSALSDNPDRKFLAADVLRSAATSHSSADRLTASSPWHISKSRI